MARKHTGLVGHQRLHLVYVLSGFGGNTNASITNIIEGAVNSTTGIESIKSQSSPGVSVVTITFNLDKDIEVAFNEVQSKVGQTLRRLPDEITPPVVRKVETNASPIMWLGFTGDRTIQQLNVYANNI